MKVKFDDVKPYIIAEIGMDHNGDLELGVKTIKAAAEAGASAVKLQTFKTAKFLSAQNFDTNERQKYELSYDELKKLNSVATKYGLDFFSTPLDNESVTMLNKLGVSMFKLASADINNIPLINEIRKTSKPVIISTGYSDIHEIYAAVNMFSSLNNDLAILHCVAKYPTPIEHMNLENISLLKKLFPDKKIGLSDHSRDTVIIPAVAYGLGARIFEKHFTLDNALPGYDHSMSLNPVEFQSMCQSLKHAKVSLGSHRIVSGQIEVEKERKTGARRSIFYSANLAAGSVLTENNIIALRPGDGVSVSCWNDIVGKKLKRATKEGERFHWDDIA